MRSAYHPFQLFNLITYDSWLLHDNYTLILVYWRCIKFWYVACFVYMRIVVSWLLVLHMFWVVSCTLKFYFVSFILFLVSFPLIYLDFNRCVVYSRIINVPLVTPYIKTMCHIMFDMVRTRLYIKYKIMNVHCI